MREDRRRQIRHSRHTLDNGHDAVRGEARWEEAQYRTLPALPPGRHQYPSSPEKRRRHQQAVGHSPLGCCLRVAQGL